MTQKNIRSKIAEYFFINPTAKHSLRQLERALKISLPSVARHCRMLESDGILKKIEVGGKMFYTSNFGSTPYVIEKRLFNIRNLYSTGLVARLSDKMNNPPIVVFGSYFLGYDTEDSDIDLFIETSATVPPVGEFERKLSRKIHILTAKKLANIKNKNLINNIINGMILNGFLEVF